MKTPRTRVARRTTREKCMRGAAKCTSMSPRFSMVVGQSDCYFFRDAGVMFG